MPTSSPVVLITGASSGIGQTCARHLSSCGYRVYGTSRQAPEPKDGVFHEDAGVRLLPLDVTDDLSVARGVAWVLAAEGRIDVLVNNAGNGIAGAVEDTPLDEAKGQVETNFWGMVRLCQVVLPAMRARGSGRIVNLSSMAGRIGIPFQAFYTASKFAIEGVTEALSLELAPFGIHVCMIEPGDFHTGFTAHRRRVSRPETAAEYEDACSRALGVMEHDELNGPTPELIARTLECILAAPRPRLRYPVGRFDQKLAVVLKSVLPGRWFEAILRSTYKLG